MKMIKEALNLEKQAHGTQRRDCGEKYYHHPVRVMSILREYGFGSEVLASALLHDTLEDTWLSFIELQERFGRKVAFYVFGVSKQKGDDKWIEKMIEYARADENVLYIKLADRLDNVRSMECFTEERRKKYIDETKKLLDMIEEVLETGIFYDLKEKIEKAIYKKKDWDNYQNEEF